MHISTETLELWGSKAVARKVEDGANQDSVRAAAKLAIWLRTLRLSGLFASPQSFW